MQELAKFPQNGEVNNLEKKSSNVRFDLDVYNDLQRVLTDNKISGQGSSDLASWVSEACRTMLQVESMVKGAGMDIAFLRMITIEAVKRYLKEGKARK